MRCAEPDVTDPISIPLAVLAILATPGPTNALLAASAALVGMRRSLPLLLAELAGYALAIAVLKGVGQPLLALHPGLAAGLRLVLFLYLLVLAWRLWNGPALRVGNAISMGRVFVTTALNPKAAILAFLVFPDIADAGQALVHAGYFAAVAVPLAIAWLALGAGLGGTALGGRKLLVSRVAAVPIMAFAILAGGPAAFSLL